MSAFPKCRNTLLRMSARIRLKALRCVSWIQNAERPCRLSECHTCLSFVCVFMCFSVCVCEAVRFISCWTDWWVVTTNRLKSPPPPPQTFTAERKTSRWRRWAEPSTAHATPARTPATCCCHGNCCRRPAAGYTWSLTDTSAWRRPRTERAGETRAVERDGNQTDGEEKKKGWWRYGVRADESRATVRKKSRMKATVIKEAVEEWWRGRAQRVCGGKVSYRQDAQQAPVKRVRMICRCVRISTPTIKQWWRRCARERNIKRCRGWNHREREMDGWSLLSWQEV